MILCFVLCQLSAKQTVYRNPLRKRGISFSPSLTHRVMNNPRYQLYQRILERESEKLITPRIVIPNKVLSEVLFHINLVLLI